METEDLQMGLSVFSLMIFLIWFLPGMVCRKGKFPEDRRVLK